MEFPHDAHAYLRMGRCRFAPAGLPFCSRYTGLRHAHGFLLHTHAHCVRWFRTAPFLLPVHTAAFAARFTHTRIPLVTYILPLPLPITTVPYPLHHCHTTTAVRLYAHRVLPQFTFTHSIYLWFTFTFYDTRLRFAHAHPFYIYAATTSSSALPPNCATQHTRLPPAAPACATRHYRLRLHPTLLL